jgi:hypothetical protein
MTDSIKQIVAEVRKLLSKSVDPAYTDAIADVIAAIDQVAPPEPARPTAAAHEAWLRKMADKEDKHPSISVGGLIADLGLLASEEPPKEPSRAAALRNWSDDVRDRIWRMANLVECVEDENRRLKKELGERTTICNTCMQAVEEAAAEAEEMQSNLISMCHRRDITDVKIDKLDITIAKADALARVGHELLATLTGPRSDNLNEALQNFDKARANQV